MPNFFIVRVVLHCAGKEERTLYDLLHLEMHAKGFRRTIQATTGGRGRYHLPHAEYLYDHPGDTGRILTRATAAASAVCADHEVLVSGCADCFWSNLRPVESDDDPDAKDAANYAKRMVAVIKRLASG